jgi:cell division protein FtsZ
MAISSPLLEASIDGAHGVLLSIQGGSDLGLFEINEAAQLVSNSAAVDANIIFGAVIDDALGDEVRVTVIAAGFDEQRPSRPASTSAISLSGGRPSAAAGSGSAGGNGASAGNGASGGSSATWGGPGTSSAHGQAETATGGHTSAGAAAVPAQAPAHGPSVSASAVSGSPVSGMPVSGAHVSGAHVSGAHVSGSPVSGNGGGGAGKAPGSGNGAAGAHPGGEALAQPVGDAAAGYVPSPVLFVSPDEDDEYGNYDSGRTDAAAGGASAQGAGQSWKDSGRGKQDKVYDVTAGRRRPVVFEEEDDLDVPDFLK